MKLCLYALRGKEDWQLRISLDIRVDLRWWAIEYREAAKKLDSVKVHNVHREVTTIWLLKEKLPLGWAVILRDNFVHSSEMDKWVSEDWDSYIEQQLKHELKHELKKEKEASLHVRKGGWKEAGIIGDSAYVLWESKKGFASKGMALLKPGTLGEWMDAGDKTSGNDVLNLGTSTLKKTATVMGKPTDAVGVHEAAVWWRSVAHGSERLSAALAGRSLLEAELQQLLAERLPELAPAWRSAVQHAHLQGRVELTAGVVLATGRRGQGPRSMRARTLRCRRCGSEVHRRTPCGSCGLSGCAYCEACLALGRSRSCALLLRGSAGAAMPPDNAAAMLLAEGVAAQAQPSTDSLLDRWGLSPAQRAAAGSALQFLASFTEKPTISRREFSISSLASKLKSLIPIASSVSFQEYSGSRQFLLWAVTGAGKTEMIFPLLQYVLDRGGRVLVATPRRDVVLELAPRVAKAFPEEKMAVLYGGSTQRWDDARLFLATTHQLLRFYRAFDLVIIDELDAFPYHNDPMLAFAAKSSCAASGSFVFLSATPPDAMQREVKSGTLPHAKVPARFHGHPLPVPRHINMNRVVECIRKQFLPKRLIGALVRSVRRGAQVFLFVSRIRHITPMVRLLRGYFPGIPIEGTSSKDERRGEKVIQFRATEIRILVTTTILERGVTVPKSDVYILDADSDLFDEASLVQMAGRAGRSMGDPDGFVWFASPEWTRSQRKAISQIRSMNEVAKKHGYLKLSDLKQPLKRGRGA